MFDVRKNLRSAWDARGARAMHHDKKPAHLALCERNGAALGFLTEVVQSNVRGLTKSRKQERAWGKQSCAQSQT